MRGLAIIIIAFVALSATGAKASSLHAPTYGAIARGERTLTGLHVLCLGASGRPVLATAANALGHAVERRVLSVD
jgi:hypothetical protein